MRSPAGGLDSAVRHEGVAQLVNAARTVYENLRKVVRKLRLGSAKAAG